MWVYNGAEIKDEDVEEFVGFVYLITNTLTGKRYVGKKLFKFSKTKKVKGKRKKYKVDSDWKTYYGSNDALNEDVESTSKSYFKREILHLCKTKGTASYLEMKEQVLRNVLESDDYYNQQIRCRVHKSHLKL